MIVYFASTLPYLYFEASPSMSPEAFVEAARGHLSAAEFAPLAALATGGKCAHAFVVAWRRFDVQFHSAVAKVRAERLNVDAAPFLKETTPPFGHPSAGGEDAVENAVVHAFEEGNPLKREEAFLRFRFRKAEELAGIIPMTLSTLLAYYLHLVLLSSRLKRDVEKGRERREKWLKNL